VASRTALARFGGDWSWPLDNAAAGLKLNIGEAIRGEGPGEGFAMLPWALDHYERVLRLGPGEAWLLKRMLVRAWEYGGLVYLSMRKISFESCVSRNALQRYVKALTKLGYIVEVGRGAGADHRVRYDVSGTYAALALCIAADPASSWARAHGGSLSLAVAKSKTHTLPSGSPNGHKPPVTRFNLDFRALEQLSQRRELGGIDE
jgi:hypothetical protein